MRFVEFKDVSGAVVLVNAAGILFLRPAESGCTDVHFAGRQEPLRLDARVHEVAEALEEAAPEPPEPMMSLLS
ncbi:hypothetical protein [Azospirillum sp. SYSU D00513]|uniref:hypothetical protein n=1 Tax=Azospirillum sp. SYSU D00513 TaxID=2812561 RepID=UPI001A95D151|nr:hypothetical protein [Azospirillum sp. SYSU D00513]